MLDSISPLGIFILSFFLLLFFDGNLLLYLEKLFVGFLELLSGASSSLLSFHVSQLFSFDFFFDLFLNELALELLLLHFLNVVELEILQLVLNILCVSHFFMILFFQFFSESLVVFCHFLFFKLVPLILDFLMKLCLSLLGHHLLFLLCNNIAHEHFRVKCFHLIGIIVEHLIGFGKLILSQSLLIELLLGIYFPSFDLL